MLDRQDEQSPMTRESLIFELGRCQGMLSRILSDCSLLLETTDGDLMLRDNVRTNMEEARELIREQWRSFYGVRDEQTD